MQDAAHTPRLASAEGGKGGVSQHGASHEFLVRGTRPGEEQKNGYALDMALVLGTGLVPWGSWVLHVMFWKVE